MFPLIRSYAGLLTKWVISPAAVLFCGRLSTSTVLWASVVYRNQSDRGSELYEYAPGSTSNSRPWA